MKSARFERLGVEKGRGLSENRFFPTPGVGNLVVSPVLELHPLCEARLSRD